MEPDEVGIGLSAIKFALGYSTRTTVFWRLIGCPLLPPLVFDQQSTVSPNTLLNLEQNCRTGDRLPQSAFVALPPLISSPLFSQPGELMQRLLPTNAAGPP